MPRACCWGVQTKWASTLEWLLAGWLVGRSSRWREIGTFIDHQHQSPPSSSPLQQAWISCGVCITRTGLRTPPIPVPPPFPTVPAYDGPRPHQSPELNRPRRARVTDQCKFCSDTARFFSSLNHARGLTTWPHIHTPNAGSRRNSDKTSLVNYFPW